MSELTRFIHDCHLALRTADPKQQIAELVADVIRDPTALNCEIEAMGSALGANAKVLHRAPDLTILRIRLFPGFWGDPHDHLMWLVAGAYVGQEDTVLYRREPDRLVEIGRRSLVAPDVLVLAEDIVHSSHNPLATEFLSLQVCGGDFVAATPRRSRWDPKTFERRPFTPVRE